MKIAFRVDASARIGVGHLARCLTLARRLTALGVSVEFYCRKTDQYSYSQLLTATHRVIFLEDQHRSEELVAGHQSPEIVWTPHDQEADAIAVIKALGGCASYDWLIADHYGLDICWEKKVGVVAKRLMVIDDLANREHDCDLLLDQGYYGDQGNRYSPLIPDKCRVALGPGYALLSQRYSLLRRERLRHSGIPSSHRSILVCFGGTDQKNLYQLVIEAFRSANLENVRLEVVLGGSTRHVDYFRRQTQFDESILILHQRTSLAELMAQASLFVGGIGHTTWERCCLGVPALGISLAQNQEQLAERLNRAGVLSWIGTRETITCSTLLKQLELFFQKGSSDAERESLYGLVDGKGASRILTALSAERSRVVQIRSAEEKDSEELLHWVNESTVTQFSFRQQAVKYSEHRDWFRRQLTSNDVEIFIGEIQAGMAVGQIRFSRHQTNWKITYSVESTVRGLGYGRQLLEKGIQALKQRGHVETLSAEVHQSNLASLTLFKQLDFTLLKGKSQGVVEFRKELI